MPEFVHLHVHSEYSLLDGANRIPKMVKRAKDLGMPALALTDHGNLFGAVDFYKACKAAGIKPIVGCELYVAAGNRKDRGPQSQKYHHLVLLAQNHEGYINLARLSSIGYLEGFYYKPRIDLETLSSHSAGLICLSACMKGMVPQAVMDGKMREAQELMGRHLDIFGRDRYFLELQEHGIQGQKEINIGLLELAKKNEVRLAATNDSHYLDRSDAALHEALLCINTGKTLSDETRMQFNCDAFFLKTARDMAQVFGEIPESLSNTLAIADQCALDLPLGKFHLPRYDPPGGLTEEQYFLQLVEEGLRQRFGDPLPASIRARADFEIEVIKKSGYVAYFLIVWDFIHFAKTSGIPVGPGRGSAAGSLIAYALDITELNPLEHGLLFERFLNPERVSPPDIDVDFCFERRGEVIEYVRKKYGSDRVAQIITFGTLKAKASIRDVGRVLGVPLSIVDKAAKLVPEGPKVTLEGAVQENPELKQLIESDAQVAKIMQLAQRMEGAVRHCSVHAAGVVICDRPLTDYLPLYKAAGDDTICTQFPMGIVEEIGLLKMDFLGIKNLTIIERVIQELKRGRKIEIDWTKIPLDDPKTYQVLQAGDTEGVFQLESEGMTKLVMKLRPTEFADITALLALYRPGPLGAGMDAMYVERKHGRQRVIYDHPLVEPILKETYGIILYQEQVMNIAKALAGFTLGQADVLRKAMGKKKADLMAQQRAKFVEGCVKNSIAAELADHIWNQIETFAGYGFNKSHSAAYAVVTFRTAYLKAHYPVEFMAALMSNEVGNQAAGKLAIYANVCREKSIQVLPPDVNHSHALFTVERGECVRFGLAAIKGVGIGAVQLLDAERASGGPFRSLMDFCMRIPTSCFNARGLEALIRAGAFDSIESRRRRLEASIPQVVELASQRQRERAEGQFSLFDMMSPGAGTEGANGGAKDANGWEDALSLNLPDVPEWPVKERLAHEKVLLGFYLSGHPLDRYRLDVQSFSNCPTGSLAQKSDGQEVLWLGMLTRIQPRVDKNGNAWAIAEGEDYEGSLELKFWSKTYERVRDLLEPDALIAVRGRISRWGGTTQIEALDAQPIEELRKARCTSIRAEWDAGRMSQKALDQLESIGRKFKGRKPIEITLRQSEFGVLAFDLQKPPRVNPTDECLEALQKIEGLPRIRLCTEA